MRKKTTRKPKRKARKSASRKGRSSHSKSGASVKLGKATQALGKMSRSDFIKMAGISAAATAAGATVLGNVAKAQVPPPSCTPSYNPVFDAFFTLAAFVDTALPGVEGYPVSIQVFDPASGNLITVGTMCNLGAPGTGTAGAAACPNSYNYSYLLAPILAHDKTIIQTLVSVLDSFIIPYSGIPPNYAKFKDLPYSDTPTQIPDPNNPGKNIVIPGRYTILYLMDKPDLLVARGVPLEDAANTKRLFTLAHLLVGYVAYSEVCNLFPSGQDSVTKLPFYERNSDNTWNVIPGSFWDQMGYPGPSYKEPSYATEYDGLRVTIADGKVKFENR
jgi:hypothetical protein